MIYLIYHTTLHPSIQHHTASYYTTPQNHRITLHHPYRTPSIIPYHTSPHPHYTPLYCIILLKDNKIIQSAGQSSLSYLVIHFNSIILHHTLSHLVTPCHTLSQVVTPCQYVFIPHHTCQYPAVPCDTH